MSRLKVTKMECTHTVAAGDCTDYPQTDVVDPAAKITSTKICDRGSGRVLDWSRMRALQLVEFKLRTPPPQSDGN